MGAQLTVLETSVLSGAKPAVVRKAIEHRIVEVQQAAKSKVAGGRAQPVLLDLNYVGYFRVIIGSSLQDAPVSWKKRVAARFRRGSIQDDFVEFAPALLIDVHKVKVGETLARAERYAAARDTWIVEDPEVMGGAAVLRGTRLTCHALAQRLKDKEETIEDFQAAYPAIPAEAFEAAHLFAETHPRRGRPVDSRSAF